MSDDQEPGNAGYDEFVAAVEDGEGYYLECTNGHGSLPPRRVCPHCGTDELIEVTLPEEGTIETYTETVVPTPSFSEDAPYILAIAAFGPVRITAQLRDTDAVSVGDDVTVDVVERETTDDPLLIFRPA